MDALREFETPTEDSWKKLISKSLKINDLTEFQAKAVHGLKINPFHFPKPEDSSNNPLQSGDSNWKIGINLGESANNQNIISLLKNGVESIGLSANVASNLPKLLDGVYSDMIYHDFTFVDDSDSDIEQILQYFKASDVSNSMLMAGMNLTVNGVIDHQEEIQAFSRVHFLTAKSKANNFVESLASMCAQIHGYLKLVALSKINVSQIRAEVKVSHHLPTNVSMMRALRVLWANLLSLHEIDFHPLFVKALIVKETSHDDDMALIANTNAIINSILGTANLIHVDAGSNDINMSRLNSNIQHILKMESRTEHIADPLAGSYSIESMTKELAKEAWENFKNHIV